MKERPILFSGPMVRAILDGRKTQTRRVVKPQPKKSGRWWAWKNWEGSDDGDRFGPMLASIISENSPYGAPRDRLWVRETWGPCAGGIVYRADEGTACPDAGKWKPSIFMPRWASRITLEIVSVRVERLHDISDSDAIREGIPDYPNFTGDSPVHDYSALWESINGPGSWDANPWVWVIEFRRIEKP